MTYLVIHEGVAMKRVSEGFIDFKPNPNGWKNYRMDAESRYLALSRELTRRNRNFVRTREGWVASAPPPKTAGTPRGAGVPARRL